MDTELHDAWVDAMDSGLYEQGDGYLNRQGTYCCLGVLCETAIDRGMPVERISDRDYYHDTDNADPEPKFYFYRLVGEGQADSSLLTPGLLELFDMTENEQITLAEANDAGHTFAEIIDALDDEGGVAEDAFAFAESSDAGLHS